jgi:ATP-dependent helicase/nuclease subunit B
MPANGALRGSVLHDALNRFARAQPRDLAPDVAGALMARLDDALRDYTADARIRAFWLPRFARFADWFAATEAARREGTLRIAAEADGAHIIAAPAGPFVLTARADRIDVGESHCIVTDYKTGNPPERRTVTEMRAPQLALEAAILLAGGFAGLPSGPVSALRFIKAGGGDPPGEEIDVVSGTAEVEKLARETLEKLVDMVARFDNPSTAYAATRRTGFSYDYDSYEHLARVDEWSADEGGPG